MNKQKISIIINLKTLNSNKQIYIFDFPEKKDREIKKIKKKPIKKTK